MALLRTKGLLALSGLVRHSPAALHALLTAKVPAAAPAAAGAAAAPADGEGQDAVGRLVDLAGDADVRVRR